MPIRQRLRLMLITRKCQPPQNAMHMSKLETVPLKYPKNGTHLIPDLLPQDKIT